MSTVFAPAPRTRQRIRVRGQVQGVGFRPFVYRLARELGLAGWVCNDAHGVVIEVQGQAGAVSAFLVRLPAEAPPLARIARIEAREVDHLPSATAFAIRPSAAGHADTSITPDTAVCRDCLTELFDPGNRRHRYPFINCTQCGPRYTITQRLPYDRPNTTMAHFRQCPACLAEYRSPSHRRFHAQPNACGACGPQVWLANSAGEAQPCDDVPAEIAARIARGEVLAVKGMGGFHLVCDAQAAYTVGRLRAAKNREEKPFAVMVANADSARAFAQVSAPARAALESAEGPIVLLPKTPGCDAQLSGIAPGLPEVGVMLPATPLQYLIFHELAGRPPGSAWLDQPLPWVLVATSANPGGEPLVIGNDEALARLRGIADGYVFYDRDIVTRVDDSVLRIDARAGGERLQFVRRARGYTPRAIALGDSGGPVLAVGAQWKSTLCLTRGDEAFVSQHVGDLDSAACCRHLEETAEHLMAVLQIEPQAVARDAHPDFFSSRFAEDFAARRGLPVVVVQHHHAHAAAVAAEHRLAGPLLGVALDGVGLGSDNGVWGGELLRLDGASFRRIGHFTELRLPGGDRAAREPWRMAAAALHAVGRTGEIDARFPGGAGATVRRMLEQGVNAQPTSSCGRWFDAAAGLLGVREVIAYEGQAAMLLEGLAASRGAVPPLADGFRITPDCVLDLTPLIARLADETDAAHGAALFHATLVEAVARWTLRAAHQEALDRVALGGGCFLNRLLSAGVRTRLEAAGLAVFEAAQVPPNDGGVSLGQAWVARQAAHA